MTGLPAMLSDSARQAIRTALAGSADAGERRQRAEQCARQFGVSVSTIYRAAPTGRRRKASSNPNYIEWVRTAVAVAERAPDGPVVLDLAIAACIESGLLPPEAGAMPIGTAYRIRRALNLNDRQGRLARIDADYPMQAVQFDGSSSKYLSVVDGPDADGDWLLKLYRRPISARGYKNKPLGPDRERLVTYGVTDICTGLRWSEYRVARGENALDAIEALVGMLATPEPDSARRLCGVPDDLWLDLGPITKSPITLDLLERLNINLVTGEPYRKTRMAVVERAWRTLWGRFERSLFLLPSPELRLSELQTRLCNYLAQENARRPARTRVGEREVSRLDAWEMLLRRRARDNPLREMPANALATLAQEDRRWVDATGRMRYRSKQYDVPQLHDTYVQVLASLDGEQVLARCLRSGLKVTCRVLEAAAYGHPPGRAQTPLARALAGAPDFPGADVFGAGDEVPVAGVARLPAPVAGAAPLEDPLDITRRYPSLEAAMLDFARLCPVALLPRQREQVAGMITAADFSQEAVAELARDILSSTAASAERTS